MANSNRVPALKAGFIDAIALVKAVLGVDGSKGVFNDDCVDMHREKYRRYWGAVDRRDIEVFQAIAKVVYGAVFDPSMHDTDDHYGSLLLKQIGVYPDDWWLPREGEADGADGETPFCSLVGPEGEKAKAYLRSRGKNQGVGIHFCEPIFFDQRVTIEEFTGTDETCSSVDERISTARWSQKLLGVAILHEFTLGNTIWDPAYGINNVLALGNDKYWKDPWEWYVWDKPAPVKPYYNADTWAWFALVGLVDVA
ncbi:MAG: hypothetical protein Q9160_003770 [Pyrenula sp. 1 TL-2023]